jgi:hypothetical protein
MNFRTAFVIFFYRQFFPLTAQVKRLYPTSAMN